MHNCVVQDNEGREGGVGDVGEELGGRRRSQSKGEKEKLEAEGEKKNCFSSPY
jgi:hypothetical protein